LPLKLCKNVQKIILINNNNQAYNFKKIIINNYNFNKFRKEKVAKKIKIKKNKNLKMICLSKTVRNLRIKMMKMKLINPKTMHINNIIFIIIIWMKTMIWNLY
jgi:hypothetical protein